MYLHSTLPYMEFDIVLHSYLHMLMTKSHDNISYSSYARFITNGSYVHELSIDDKA